MDPKSKPKPKGASFKGFLKERSMILSDIKQFLSMVFQYCLYMEKNTKSRHIGAKIRTHLPVLMESVCLIHALYGYPDSSGNETGNKLNSNCCPVFGSNKLALICRRINLYIYITESVYK